jgi:hypothetical protein
MDLSSVAFIMIYGGERYILITMVTPAMPAFFWAPANMMPYLETSTGWPKKLDDMSHTIGTEMSDVGTKGNFTPMRTSVRGK